MIIGNTSRVSRLGLVLFGSVGILAACGGNEQSQARVEGERSASPEPSGKIFARDLPLTKGVYAYVDDPAAAPSCPPPLATIATFDGVGFGGRNSTNCHFDPRQRVGSVWSGTQTCTDTYSEQQRTEAWTITVESRTRYTLRSLSGASTFKLCPDENLSDWMADSG